MEFAIFPEIKTIILNQLVDLKSIHCKSTIISAPVPCEAPSPSFPSWPTGALFHSLRTLLQTDGPCLVDLGVRRARVEGVDRPILPGTVKTSLQDSGVPGVRVHNLFLDSCMFPPQPLQ